MKYKKIMILITILTFMISHYSLDIYALNSKNEMIIEVSDHNGIWNERTCVDIFKISYHNNNTNIIMNSDLEDKIIAPGSHNSYTFKVKNVSTLPVDYTLHVSCNILPDNVAIPLKYRVRRYDGNWVSGNENDYMTVNSSSHDVDKMTLSSNSYAYYTLEWIWPYESMCDEYDTFLGNIAKDEDIMLTMTLDVKASVNKDNNASGGIVDTSDHSDIYIYFIILCMSLFCFALLYKKHS